MPKRWLTLGLGAALLAPACDASKVDGRDLRGVYEPRASSSASGSASAPAAPPASAPSAPPGPVQRVRTPVKGPCVTPQGEPAKPAERVGKRPACRNARVLEHRDPLQIPRYACVFEPRGLDEHKPLPLVVFLHGAYDDPTAVHRETRLRRRYRKLDLTGDPDHPGFVVVAPQARRIGSSLRWDVDYTGTDHADVVAIDTFVDELVGEGIVDARQVYAIGESRGGTMAMLYAHQRPDRVAAVGVFAAAPTAVDWTCDGLPPPVGVLYRACDSEVPCPEVEAWLAKREEAEAPTFRLRLGPSKATEPSCALSKKACGPKAGKANHLRWPKIREADLLEWLGRFSLQVDTSD